MKNYEDMAKAVLEARDEYIKKKKKRILFVKRASAISFGAAAIIGIGIFANALKPPQKPTAESSVIITNTTEAVTTSAESTVQTSAKSVTTQKHSIVTTSAQTETAASKLTTAATGNVTVKEPDKSTETASSNSTITAIMTTFQTESTIPRSIRSAESQTTVRTSTTSSAKETETTAMQTTAVATNMATESITTTQSFSEWLGVYYDDSKTTYRAAWKDNEKISATEDELGEYLGEQTLHLTYTMSNEYVDEVCKVYTIKRFSPDYVLAVQSPADDSPKLSYAGAKFKTLGDLLTGTDLKNTLVLKEAYRGFIEPNSEPLGVPELSELMDLLSNESLKSLDSSIYGNNRSYTIKAEIPYLGKEGRIVIIEDILEPESGYISFEILGNKCTYNVGADKINTFVLSFTN